MYRATKASKAEKELLKLIGNPFTKCTCGAAEENNKTIDRIAKLKQKLRDTGVCTHPSTQKFQWEWDNGYGKQKWITGLRCNLCNWKQSWGQMDGLWYHPDTPPRNRDD